MTVSELLKLILDNGVTLGMLIYFIFKDNTTNKELIKRLDNLEKAIRSPTSETIIYRGEKEWYMQKVYR